MKSEVLENYFKIAQEQGLIEKSAYPQTPDYKQGFKDGRQGSDDISTIEALYGIKPNGKEDDTDMVDKAHPSTAVISPAYDKFNGVVENLKEQHARMSQVATKNPNGNYTQRRYIEAKQDLLNSLVSVGYAMDNKNHQKLMALADSCAEKLTKESWSFFSRGPSRSYGVPGRITGLSGWGWGIGLAAILGATYMINHTKTFDQGTVNNLKLVLEKAAEAIEKCPPMAKGLFKEFAGSEEGEGSTVAKLSALVKELHETEITKDTPTDVIQHRFEQIKEFKDLSKKYKSQLSSLTAILESVEAEPGEKDEPHGQIISGIKSGINFLTGGVGLAFSEAANTAQESLDKEITLLENINKAAKIKAEKIQSKEPASSGSSKSEIQDKEDKKGKEDKDSSKPSDSAYYFRNI